MINMTINQLFKIKPSLYIIIQIVSFFDIKLNDLHKKNSFNNKNLKLSKEQLNNIKYLLIDYYIPCKKKIYLDIMTTKKAITILRQLLKLYNYSLESHEKYNNSKKIIVYTIIDKNEKKIDDILYFN